MDSLMLEMAQIVVKSVDNITTRSCETSKSGSLCLTVGLGGFAILVLDILYKEKTRYYYLSQFL